MSIQSTCPGCGEVGAIPETLKGKKVRCKKCQHIFVVKEGAVGGKRKEEPLDVVLADDRESLRGRPEPARAAPRSESRRRRFEDDRDNRDDRERQPRAEESKGSSGLILILGGIGAVVLLAIGLCGGAVYYFVYSVGKADEQMMDDIQADMDAAQQDAFEIHKPINNVDDGLFALRSANVFRRQKGAEWFVNSAPNDVQRAEVCRALEAGLNDGDHWVKENSAKALANWANQDHVDILVRLLDDRTSQDIRRRALEKLGNTQDEKAAEAVAKRLPDFFDRQHAVAALKRMGPAGAKAALKFANHQDNATRDEARRIVEAVGGFQDELLQQSLADLDSPNVFRRRSLVDSLAQLKLDPAAQAKVAKAMEAKLGDGDHHISETAARILSQWATRDNVPALIEGLKHRWHNTRMHCIQALGRLKDERAVGPLSERLKDGFDRTHAVAALKELGRTNVDLDEKLEDLKSPDIFRRRRALDWLASTRVDEARRDDVLKALDPFLRDSDPNVVGSALRALTTWANQDSVTKLVDALNALPKTPGATPARHALIEALARVKDEKAIAAIASRAADPLDAKAAFFALQIIGTPAEGELAKLTANTHPTIVRFEACRILSLVGTKASIPVLQGLSTDPDRNINLAARAALTAVSNREKK